jgi:acyl dehydratase
LLRGWKSESKATPLAPAVKGAGRPVAPTTRPSNGMDQFFASIQGQHQLRILDLAGASQANISYITNLGHRLYSDDILRTLDDSFGSGPDFLSNQSDPGRIHQFLSQTLDFPPAHFDGALVWDTMQFLSPQLLQLTIERLRHILRSSAYLLAFFHAEEKAEMLPAYSYRIVDSKTLSLALRGERKPAQFFNNRSLEKLFHEFQSVKFFLTRDHLREVIVRR